MKKNRIKRNPNARLDALLIRIKHQNVIARCDTPASIQPPHERLPCRAETGFAAQSNAKRVAGI